MARININLGTPPSGQDGDPVRTAFEKVNTMTTELYQGIDVANGSGWGKAKPQVFQPSDSANNLPAVSGIFLFNNGGLDLPTPYAFVEQFTSGGGWIVQKAHALNGPGTWVRKFTPGNAAASLWQLDSIGGGAINGNIGASNLKMQQDFRDSIGIGTPYTYCIDIDSISPATGLKLGYSYVMQDTKGTKPGGYVYGVVNTVINSGDHAQQEFVGLNGIAGVTQRAYRRSGYGADSAKAWGPWRLVIDSASSTLPVEEGGVVSRTVASGIAVTKLACGLQIVNGNFGTTPVIEPNAFTIVTLTIPVNTGPDVSYTTVNPIASPYTTNDWYGITNAYMNSPTSLQLVIRNGPTSAQAFGVRGTIVGHWK